LRGSLYLLFYKINTWYIFLVFGLL